MRRLLSLLGWTSLAAGLGFALLGLSAFALPEYWLSDNMSFFLYQLLTGAGLAGLVSATILPWLAHRKGLYRAAIALLVTVFVIVAGLTVARTLAVSNPVAGLDGDQHAIRFASINLERLYLGDDRLMGYLQRLDADVLVFQETAWWLQRHRSARHGLPDGLAGVGPYPDHYLIGELGNLAVFSAYPFQKIEYIRVPGTPAGDLFAEREILALELATPRGPLQVVAVHPASPRTRQSWGDRQRYLGTLEETVARRKTRASGPVLVIGDWNTAPWSGHFAGLLDEAGLKSGFPGNVPQATRFFFDYRLRWVLGAPVDHVAVTPDLAIVDMHLGPDVGTDHRPLVVDLGFAAGRGAEGRTQ